MAPDYDLSNLHTDQADLWIYLQVGAIVAEILADQPERRTTSLTVEGCTQRCSPYDDCEVAGGTEQRITGSRHIGVGLGNKEVN